MSLVVDAGAAAPGIMDMLSGVLFSARFEIIFLASALLILSLGSLLPQKSRGGPKKPSPPRACHSGTSTSGDAAATRDRKHRPAPHVSGDRPKGGGNRPAPAASGDARIAHRGALELKAAADGLGNQQNLSCAEWVLPRVARIDNADEACAALFAALDAGMDPLEADREEQLGQVVETICLALVRAGSAHSAVRLLQRLQSMRVPVPVSLGSSLVRLCTARQYFQEAISVSDTYLKDSSIDALDKSVWSCLLFCAVEVRAFGRCQYFIERLKSVSTPSVKDYWNIVRYYSSARDCDKMFGVLKEMEDSGVEADSIVYNTVLATCVSCNNIEQARTLLEDMNEVGGVADVITYNTLMKGYAKAGMIDECFKLFQVMRARDLEASQVTYGILLDGCINGCQVDKASTVFNIMLENKCPMNTVLYTTLIKGFAREGKVDEAMRVYGQMLGDASVKPDLITYSVLMKANCDQNRLDAAFELLDTMLKRGLHPDEVIFNNLLSGCAKAANGELAKRIYDDMIASGVTPSNATFSILVRIYSQCKLLDAAVEMIRTEPRKYKVELEPRVFSQLIQACVRARQGRRAVEAYEYTLDSITPSPAFHSSVLSACTKLNMHDTAADLLAVAAAKGARVDARDAGEVYLNACRKQKIAIVTRMEESLKELCIPVPVS